MLQNHFERNMRIMLSILIILIVLLVIATIIYCCITIYNSHSNTNENKHQKDDIQRPSNISKTKDTSNNVSLKNKYKSVFEWQVYTGDFGEDQLQYLNTQCIKYDIPMEIMLSIICTESSFRSTAKATTSSASGYCQVTKGTAKWIYEDKLNYGVYDIDNHTEIMTTNWELNMEISCRYMYYLYHNSNKSWELAVQKYYGSSNSEDNIMYLNKVNTNMNDLFGMNISDIK